MSSLTDVHLSGSTCFSTLCVHRYITARLAALAALLYCDNTRGVIHIGDAIKRSSGSIPWSGHKAVTDRVGTLQMLQQLSPAAKLVFDNEGDVDSPSLTWWV